MHNVELWGASRIAAQRPAQATGYIFSLFVSFFNFFIFKYENVFNVPSIIGTKAITINVSFSISTYNPIATQ